MISNPKAATFTRPNNTTQYTAGDLVANNTSAGSVAPLEFKVTGDGGGSVRIKRFRLTKSGTGVTTPAFRLHLFSVAPTVTNGDNGAFAPPVANWVGALDVTAMTAGSNGAFGAGAPVVGSEISLQLPTGSVFGLLEARDTYTPGAQETFTAALEVDE